MKRFKIIGRDEYSNYLLKDDNLNTYEVNINFMNMDSPDIGTILYIKKEVLDEKVSLNFGAIKNKELTEDKIIIIEKNNEKIYLERFYG